MSSGVSIAGKVASCQRATLGTEDARSPATSPRCCRNRRNDRRAVAIVCAAVAPWRRAQSVTKSVIWAAFKRASRTGPLPNLLPRSAYAPAT
jgi:hypothetical protein